MAEPAQDTASLRFRLYDGTDLGPVSYPLSTTVGAIKEAVLHDWPQERERPEGPGALKLILSGRLLGNEMTLADARTPTDALVTMHLVVAPPKQPGKKAPKAPAPDGVAHPASSGCCVVS